MTCIVGVRWDGGALLAADSGVSGATVARMARPKIAERDGYLIGVAGNLAFSNVALHRLSVEAPEAGLHDWAVCVFVDELKAAVSAAGIPDEDRGLVLLAAPGSLVCVDEGFGVHDYCDEYAAIGSGETCAVGALFAGVGREPSDRALVALGAARRHCEGIVEPFRVLMIAEPT